MMSSLSESSANTELGATHDVCKKPSNRAAAWSYLEAV